MGDLRNVFLLLLSLSHTLFTIGWGQSPTRRLPELSFFFLLLRFFFCFCFGFHSWKKADVNVDLIIYSVRDSGCPVPTPLVAQLGRGTPFSPKGQFFVLFLFSFSSYGLFICVCNHDRYQRTKGAPLGSLSFYCLLSRIKQQIKTLENAKKARETSHI